MLPRNDKKELLRDETEGAGQLHGFLSKHPCSSRRDIKSLASTSSATQAPYSIPSYALILQRKPKDNRFANF
jgi:hypothetical protein